MNFNRKARKEQFSKSSTLCSMCSVWLNYFRYVNLVVKNDVRWEGYQIWSMEYF